FWELIYHTRLLMVLTGQVFKLSDPGISLLIGIIDRTCFLELFLIMSFKFELKGTIREFAIAVVEILINRPCVDQFSIRNHLLDFPIISIEHYFDIGMREHLLKHPGVAELGHGLIGVSEIAVVPI